MSMHPNLNLQVKHLAILWIITSDLRLKGGSRRGSFLKGFYIPEL